MKEGIFLKIEFAKRLRKKQDIVARIGSYLVCCPLMDQGSIRCIKISISKLCCPETKDNVAAGYKAPRVISTDFIKKRCPSN